MATYCTSVVALFCLFNLSFADHAPPVDDEISSQIAVQEESINPEKLQFNTLDVSSVPLPEFPFRPINRRFPVRSSRSCVHHRSGQRKTKEHDQISYGDGMIFSSGENGDFEEPMVYGGGRRISGRWRGPYHHHRDPDARDENRIKQIVFDREREFMVLRKLGKQNGVKDKKRRGFMRRVRKLLDHRF